MHIWFVSGICGSVAFTKEGDAIQHVKRHASRCYKNDIPMEVVSWGTYDNGTLHGFAYGLPGGDPIYYATIRKLEVR